MYSVEDLIQFYKPKWNYKNDQVILLFHYSMLKKNYLVVNGIVKEYYLC
jgi:hypothetical protein